MLSYWKEIIAKQVTGDAGDLMNTTIQIQDISIVERPWSYLVLKWSGNRGTIQFGKYIFTVLGDGTVSLTSS